MLQENKSTLINNIASICSCSLQEAKEYLDGAIYNLQELKLKGDLRLQDIRNECEGLLGVTYNTLFMQYATEMTQEENIPQELKELHAHDEDEDIEDGSEFNPMEWCGELGADVVEDYYQMIA